MGVTKKGIKSNRTKKSKNTTKEEAEEEEVEADLLEQREHMGLDENICIDVCCCVLSCVCLRVYVCCLTCFRLSFPSTCQASTPQLKEKLKLSEVV